MPTLRLLCALLACTAPLAFIQEASTPPTPTAAPSASSAVTTAPDELLHVGGKVQKPVVVNMVKPQFTQQAKQAKFSGNVLLYLYVEKDGTPSHIRVVKGVGMGLDEKAVEAVRQYRFKPATLNGQPAKVDLYVNVNFQVF